MAYLSDVSGTRYVFEDLKTLLARATPDRAGDRLAGLAAQSNAERVAARAALADLPLKTFLAEAIVPYETDEVTRLVLDTHDAAAFAPVVLPHGRRLPRLASLGRGDDGRACGPRAGPDTRDGGRGLEAHAQPGSRRGGAEDPSRHAPFATQSGLPGRLSVRLQPNHPTDDPKGIGARHPRRPSLRLRRCRHRHQSRRPTAPRQAMLLLELVDELRRRFDIPTQSASSPT